MLDKRFVAMSTALDTRMAQRDAHYTEKILKLENELQDHRLTIKRQDTKIQGLVEDLKCRNDEIRHLYDELKDGNTERQKLSVRVQNMEQDNVRIRRKMYENSRKIEAFNRESMLFLGLEDHDAASSTQD